MKLLKYIIIFLIVNFGALIIGRWFMANGAQSNWYIELSKAPWTPPGWVFGAAWTVIMICFSIYMAYLLKNRPSTKLILLFSLQFVLNVLWNFIFFNLHLTTLGLIVIMGLTTVVSIFLINFNSVLGLKTWLIAPYLIWLCIATSLNMYIVIYN